MDSHSCCSPRSSPGDIALPNTAIVVLSAPSSSPGRSDMNRARCRPPNIPPCGVIRSIRPSTGARRALRAHPPPRRSAVRATVMPANTGPPTGRRGPDPAFATIAFPLPGSPTGPFPRHMYHQDTACRAVGQRYRGTKCLPAVSTIGTGNTQSETVPPTLNALILVAQTAHTERRGRFRASMSPPSHPPIRHRPMWEGPRGVPLRNRLREFRCPRALPRAALTAPPTRHSCAHPWHR